MKPLFTNLTHISRLIADMVSHTETSSDHETVTSSWLDVALGFRAQKQIQYKGDGYVDEVERNAVHYREAATMFVATVAVFLCGGTPRLKQQEIDSYLIDLRQDAVDATG
jgi:hypothetical protein